MKKLLTLLIVSSLLFCNVPISFAGFDKSNIITEVSYKNLEQDVSTEMPLESVTSHAFNGERNYKLDDVKLSQQLALIGYKISKYATPYAILGNSSLDLNQSLTEVTNGHYHHYWPFYHTHSWSNPAETLSSDFDANDFTYGLGVKGDIVTLPLNILLSYDAFALMFKADDSQSIESINIDTEANYKNIVVNLFASKEITVNKIIKSITPKVGYRLSRVIMDVETSTNIPSFISGNSDLSADIDIRKNLQSVIAGIDIKINDSVSISANGLFGDEKGIEAKVAYRF